jgi:hypothetical protein
MRLFQQAQSDLLRLSHPSDLLPQDLSDLSDLLVRLTAQLVLQDLLGLLVHLKGLSRPLGLSQLMLHQLDR